MRVPTFVERGFGSEMGANFRIRYLFALRRVDDFVAQGAHDFNRLQQHSTEARKTINNNHLETTKFYKFQ